MTTQAATTKMPFEGTIDSVTDDTSHILGQIDNGLAVVLTDVAGTHTFEYYNASAGAWALLKAYSTATHEIITNLDGKTVRYTTASATGSVVSLSQTTSVRN